MKRDSVLIAKQKRETDKLPTQRILVETVKLEIKNIKKPVSKDKFTLMLFIEHSFIMFHKPSQFTSIDSIGLPQILVLFSEIKFISMKPEKKMLTLKTENQALLNIYFKKLPSCESMNEMLSDKIKIINSYYGGSLEKDRVWAKYYVASYFEARFNIPNCFKDKYKSSLKRDYIDFFADAFENENREIFENKLWYGKFRKHDKNVKDVFIDDIIRDVKDKTLGDKEQFGIILLSKQNIDYTKEEFENYIKHYYSILNSQFLPEWIEPNLLYLFNLEKMTQTDIRNRLCPFSEFISLM